MKAAILLMVYGDPARPDEPIDFIAAARLVGVQPDAMRRWLHRPQSVSMIRAERKAFRAALNAGNENALARIRDKSENAMAVVKSVQVLEELDQDDAHRQRHGNISPGLCIVITDGRGDRPRPVAPVVDVELVERKPDDPRDG